MVARSRGTRAEATVLVEGYVHRDPDRTRVGSTVGFVRDGDALIVIDPGMVSDRSAILDPLREAGIRPDEITDVVFSHHHPDHTLHAALFGRARFHDHWAIYEGDVWHSRAAEGFDLSPSVRLIETPGHTPQDITTLVSTEEGTMAFTHLWLSGEVGEMILTDVDALHRNRERVLALADLVVPGHGPMFVPDDHTPR